MKCIKAKPKGLYKVNRINCLNINSIIDFCKTKYNIYLTQKYNNEGFLV
jgi:hypothetical protein